ncbi:twin-arginine translocation signal domain-containing protein [Candidatus Bathyarchaeota archaeon]|nr:MAG: twin-arginine translocation signal domain-containing protein [Candidatus Bathyarchaeota archaeon]
MNRRSFLKGCAKVCL